ncbi:MAG: SH3 domain-containing protein, partial [Clostridiaceae bacterium]
MKKRITLICMIVLMLSLSVIPTQSSHALTLSTGIINADDVALRKTASANGGVITRLDEGTVVKILESIVNAEWYRVEAGTKTGYVNRLYVNIEASLPSYQLEYTGAIFNVQKDVNVRAEPSLKAKKLGKANKGDTFKVTQAYASGAWHQIDYNGTVGYVSADYMELTAKVGNDQLAGIDNKGGTLSTAFSPTDNCYVQTATQGEGDINATANKGVNVT